MPCIVLIQYGCILYLGTTNSIAIIAVNYVYQYNNNNIDFPESEKMVRKILFIQKKLQHFLTFNGRNLHTSKKYSGCNLHTISK